MCLDGMCMFMYIYVGQCVCFYNLNQDQCCMNELVVKTYFSSKFAEKKKKDKITTFCFPELETQATSSI